MGKLNIELLKAVREKIATTPEAYDQSVYARREPDAPCGTAACIAGWACVLSGAMTTEELQRRERANNQEFQSIAETAQSALGLTDDESETLFTERPEGEREDWDEDDERSGGWPAPFAARWAHSADEAGIAVQYLTHIIETGKVLE